jgi:hypothetical protein
MIQEVGVDLVAGLQPICIACNLFDLSGDVDAEASMLGPQQAEGQTRERGLAAHRVPVGRIDRYRSDPDQRLMSAGARFRHLR